MRLPTIGEIVFTFGDYRPLPVMVTDYASGPNSNGGLAINATEFGPRRGPRDVNAVLFETKEQAEAAELEPHLIKCWYKVDPAEDLINSIISALATYQSAL